MISFNLSFLNLTTPLILILPFVISFLSQSYLPCLNPTFLISKYIPYLNHKLPSLPQSYLPCLDPTLPSLSQSYLPYLNPTFLISILPSLSQPYLPYLNPTFLISILPFFNLFSTFNNFNSPFLIYAGLQVLKHYPPPLMFVDTFNTHTKNLLKLKDRTTFLISRLGRDLSGMGANQSVMTDSTLASTKAIWRSTFFSWDITDLSIAIFLNKY